MPYCLSLGSGLWEVRIDLTDGRIARVIFSVVRERMVLLHGLIRQTRQTPRAQAHEGGELKWAFKKKGQQKAQGRVGSSFDGSLAEQGRLRECDEQAIKQILADQIKAAKEKERLTKAAMAARMQTSRRALDRLLDPKNTGVTLHTLQRAAVAVDRQLRLELT